MKISNAIKLMSKSYLDRLIGSFAQDVRKLNESQALLFVEKNIKEIGQTSHIQRKLDFSKHSHEERILLGKILQFLLLQRHFEIVEHEFYNRFHHYLAELAKRYKNKDVLVGLDKRKVEIVQTLYEVVVTDKTVSIDEERLLKTLKKKMGLTDVQFNGILHTVTNIKKEYTFTDSQVESALKILQCNGLLYYLNNAEPRRFLIPEEVATVIAREYDYPLDKKSFELLFENLSRAALGTIAKAVNVPSSGSQSDVVDRLWVHGHSARELLDKTNQTELKKAAAKQELRSGGTKEDIIDRMVKCYFLLDVAPISKPKVGDEELWEYFVEFARRDSAPLRRLKLVQKDIEMERAFEQLTRYAFRKLGKLKLATFAGSNNPDGGAFDETGSELLLWDNKSVEKPYSLPLTHHKQFLQYVVTSKKPVSSFLIITGDVDNVRVVERNCIKLSGEAKKNVAVISASNFKKFMDAFAQANTGKALNTQVFNHTGVLTKETLEMRLRAFS